MSDALRTLQSKIGAVADGAFGPNTARAIAAHYELSPLHGAHLLGQASHESAGFTRTKESLYYSTPERIQAVWPSRFKTVKDAEPYAKNPTALAGKVYAGRMGNINEQEAAAFIGRGFIQLTGHTNYSLFASDMRLPEVLNDLCTDIDELTIRKITKRINGGWHGIDDRITQTTKIHRWLS